MKRAYGYIPSPKDDRDIIFQPMAATPERYVLENVPGIFDQGMDPICAAVTLKTIIGWQEGIKGNKELLDAYEIYDLRSDKNMDGMVPRQALSALKKTGVRGYKIKGYARVDSVAAAKSAIQVNGPILLATMAYTDQCEFWKPYSMDGGGHATTLVGWNKDGFVLQNSWGFSFCSGGRTIFPYSDWGQVMEAWTIML